MQCPSAAAVVRVVTHARKATLFISPAKDQEDYYEQPVSLFSPS